jgi:Protein of unknown function (DUF3592)
VSSAAPSSTTFKTGCSGRLALLGAGLLALAFTGVALIAAASEWWTVHKTQKRWPRAEATIKECKIVPHPGIRGSRVTTYSADCFITFNGTEGGFSTLPTSLEPRIAKYREWIAQHPPGSRIAAHYDPAWPPTAVPEGPPEIFAISSPRMFLKAAGIAGATALVLLVLAFVVRR